MNSKELDSRELYKRIHHEVRTSHRELIDYNGGDAHKVAMNIFEGKRNLYGYVWSSGDQTRGKTLKRLLRNGLIKLLK